MVATSARPEPTVRLDELTVALQPVLDLRTGDVYGFEALLRGPQGDGVNPPALFRRARREGWIEALEHRARELAFEAASCFLRDEEILFLNGDVRYPIEPDGYPNLVLEISEARSVDRRLIEHLQRDGLALFLDDYGVSHGNLSRLLDLRPAGIKVDREIIHGLSADRRRFIVAKTLTAMAAELGITIVAEGVETPEDLAAVREAGFPYGQGYFVGRPALVPTRERLEQLKRHFGETAARISARDAAAAKTAEAILCK